MRGDGAPSAGPSAGAARLTESWWLATWPRSVSVWGELRLLNWIDCVVEEEKGEAAARRKVYQNFGSAKPAFLQTLAPSPKHAPLTGSHATAGVTSAS